MNDNSLHPASEIPEPYYLVVGIFSAVFYGEIEHAEALMYHDGVTWFFKNNDDEDIWEEGTLVGWQYLEDL